MGTPKSEVGSGRKGELGQAYGRASTRSESAVMAGCPIKNQKSPSAVPDVLF